MGERKRESAWETISAVVSSIFAERRDKFVVKNDVAVEVVFIGGGTALFVTKYCTFCE